MRGSALHGDRGELALGRRRDHYRGGDGKVGGVLFAIRVSSHRVDELCVLPGIAARLARALTTMPADVATYKGLAAARDRLVQLLTAAP